MHYDTIVIGAGLSGLSAASLLAKSGLKVAVVEHSDTPGGSCGIFCRKHAFFDQGAAMLYGFGDHSFNAHRFLFNCLEEPITMVRHELLYTVEYNGKKIRFYHDVDQFVVELSNIFPEQATQIKHFYQDMRKLYHNVMAENPSYTTPDCTNPKEAGKNFMKHPLSYLRFLSYLNISAEELLQKYFKDPEIFAFFDKLTSTYCYATVKEAPAIMASVMFIDNHEGGSYYPAGSTLFVPGIMEKAIEEQDGDIYYNTTVTKLLFQDHRPCGVVLNHSIQEQDQSEKKSPVTDVLTADQIVYSGTVWNLYQKLLPETEITSQQLSWASAQVPTYSSVVYYALVRDTAIPADTCSITMFASSQDINESEITVYIMSLDDHTICPAHQHTVIAIGPTFVDWDTADSAHYLEQKATETKRIRQELVQHFPMLEDAILYEELATPVTIEAYTMKNGGAVAGPKQMLGQHMLKRQSIRTQWDSLYCCGESTTMGTGTPTVTTSGIATANEILKLRGLTPYVYDPHRKNYVTLISPPVTDQWLYRSYPPSQARIMQLSFSLLKCCDRLQYTSDLTFLYALLRRCACGNFTGAKNELDRHPEFALLINDSVASLESLLPSLMKSISDSDDIKEVDLTTSLQEIIDYLKAYSIPL